MTAGVGVCNIAGEETIIRSPHGGVADGFSDENRLVAGAGNVLAVAAVLSAKEVIGAGLWLVAGRLLKRRINDGSDVAKADRLAWPYCMQSATWWRRSGEIHPSVLWPSVDSSEAW